MQLNPYVHFNGNCEAAFKFYERALGGKIEAMMTYAGTPAEKDLPAEWRNKIIHARITVNGQLLMGSDAPPERYSKPQGFSVTISLKDPTKAEHIFHALAEKGQETMPIQETFWAARPGMLTDQFGIPWMINCEKVN